MKQSCSYYEAKADENGMCQQYNYTQKLSQILILLTPWGSTIPMMCSQVSRL